MSSRSLNKVTLIGNLTRDPELRFTPAGTAVCTFGLATNRSWVTQTGETREETEFHRIVAWNKLGELCSQLLAKGRKVYVEGRLATHSWTGQDGTQRTSTEIVIEDMIILDSRKVVKEGQETGEVGEKTGQGAAESVPTKQVSSRDTDSDLTEKEIKNSDKKSSKTTKGISGSDKKDDKKPQEEVTEPEKPEENSENITPDDIPF